MTLQPWEQWFPLQKRSKRSNISGDLRLSIINLPPEARCGVRRLRLPFATSNQPPAPKPPGSSLLAQATEPEIVAVTRVEEDKRQDYYALYLYLMRSLLNYDYYRNAETAGTGEMSRQTRRVLQDFATRYRIGPDFQAVRCAACLRGCLATGEASQTLTRENCRAVPALPRRQPPGAADDRVPSSARRPHRAVAGRERRGGAAAQQRPADARRGAPRAVVRFWRVSVR